MSEQETHNFMKVSVDSFSELPFIRPVPPREDTSSGSPAIRLFGIDFPSEADASQDDDPSIDPPSSTTEASNTPAGASNANTNADSGESARKFECHYCCRKFPTSQALGGHQNAHKRERQNAKRAHLHSAMAAQHYHHPSFIPNGHVYGYLNYGRHLGSVPSAARFDHPPPIHYPSWTSSGPSMSPASRFYGGLGSTSQLINGSPLPGIWRMPVHGGTAGLQGDHPPALPLFGGREARDQVAVEGGGGGVGSSSSSSSSLASPKDHGGFDSGSKNSLSLDLHL